MSPLIPKGRLSPVPDGKTLLLTFPPVVEWVLKQTRDSSDTEVDRRHLNESPCETDLDNLLIQEICKRLSRGHLDKHLRRGPGFTAPSR